jgi:hypothetical protein
VLTDVFARSGPWRTLVSSICLLVGWLISGAVPADGIWNQHWGASSSTVAGNLSEVRTFFPEFSATTDIDKLSEQVLNGAVVLQRQVGDKAWDVERYYFLRDLLYAVEIHLSLNRMSRMSNSKPIY